jgi:predicted Zn-dependent protease
MRIKCLLPKCWALLTGLWFFSVAACPIYAQLRITEPQNIPNTITCYVGGTTPHTLTPKRRLQFMPTPAELQLILDKIATHTKLIIPIEIVAVEDTDNAEACPSDGGKNYVAFKTEWMEGLYNETNNEWVVYAILAHEIGHFALGHDRVAYKAELEAQADEYAGRILALMGASLEDTLLAFRSRHLRGIPGGKYPATDLRVAAAKRGYESVAGSVNSAQIEKQSDARQYYSKGRDWSTQKVYDKAIANFTAAIALDPNNEIYYYARAIDKQFGLQDYEGAVEDYSTVIRINPGHVRAYYARGVAKSSGLKDYRGAIEDLSKVIELDPNDDDAYYARGLTKYRAKDKLAAKDDFNKACQMGNASGCKAAR